MKKRPLNQSRSSTKFWFEAPEDIVDKICDCLLGRDLLRVVECGRDCKFSADFWVRRAEAKSGEIFKAPTPWIKQEIDFYLICAKVAACSPNKNISQHSEILRRAQLYPVRDCLQASRPLRRVYDLIMDGASCSKLRNDVADIYPSILVFYAIDEHGERMMISVTVPFPWTSRMPADVCVANMRIVIGRSTGSSVWELEYEGDTPRELFGVPRNGGIQVGRQDGPALAISNDLQNGNLRLPSLQFRRGNRGPSVEYLSFKIADLEVWTTAEGKESHYDYYENVHEEQRFEFEYLNQESRNQFTRKLLRVVLACEDQLRDDIAPFWE